MNLDNRDREFFERIATTLEMSPEKLRFISENINVFTMRRHTNQLLAYYDIFRRVINVPGSIAEFGVFWGNGLFTWLNLMETFIPLDRGRKVYGFDDFHGYRRNVSSVDERAIEYITQVRGEFDVDYKVIEELVQVRNSDNVIPYDQRCVLYNGSVLESLAKFREENPGVRLALVTVDLNLREPTEFAIKESWKLIPPGGVMVFRGYGAKPWEGESEAVDEFLRSERITKVETISYNNTPGAFVTKSTMSI